jgi:hypothetical protein
MPRPESTPQRLSASSWQAESFRLTVFPAPGAGFDHTKWWRALVGTEPDSINNQPKQSLYQERGSLNEQQVLALQIQPPRIDWAVSPAEREEPSPEFPSIGVFPTALSSFTAMMGKWLGVCPPITRFALGGILHQPQVDRKAGYAQLNAYLEGWVKIDPESSDFMYQINRPRPSQAATSDLLINRLTRWAVTLHRSFLIAPEQGEPSVTTVGRQSACRLEFDINNAPTLKGPLPSDKLGALLAEFGDLAVEIAERGDVK